MKSALTSLTLGPKAREAFLKLVKLAQLIESVENRLEIIPQPRVRNKLQPFLGIAGKAHETLGKT